MAEGYRLENGTSRLCFAIGHLKRVVNEELVNNYEKTKKDKLWAFGKVTEHLLFHGTFVKNVDGICQENFDPAKVNSNEYIGNKFGNGVYFSPLAAMAMRFPLENFDSPFKVVFIAKVLEVSRTDGIEGQGIPPSPYDVTVSPDGTSIVKYDKNDYYPVYVVYYKNNQLDLTRFAFGYNSDTDSDD